MRLHRLLVPALALALLAGCGLGGRHSTATASPSPSMSDAQMLEIGREYAQCVRDHGVTGFPDPVVAQGRLAMGPQQDGGDPKQALANNPAARDACESILARLPAAAEGHRPPPTAEEMQKLLQYAQCMRDHGLPEWPDPASDGGFNLPAPLESEGKSPRVLAGFAACNSLLPPEGGE